MSVSGPVGFPSSVLHHAISLSSHPLPSSSHAGHQVVNTYFLLVPHDVTTSLITLASLSSTSICHLLHLSSSRHSHHLLPSAFSSSPPPHRLHPNHKQLIIVLYSATILIHTQTYSDVLRLHTEPYFNILEQTQI